MCFAVNLVWFEEPSLMRFSCILKATFKKPQRHVDTRACFTETVGIGLVMWLVAILTVVERGMKRFTLP